jgi:protein TonB
MFDQLPATKPSKNKKRKRAVVVSGLIHVALVSLIIIVQMAAPGRIAGVDFLTTLYMAPLPPAPPPGPPPAATPAAKERPAENTRAKTREAEIPRVVEEPVKPVKPVEQPELVQPMTIPKDIARITESAPGSGSSGTGTIGGVPGGVAGGIPGGILGGNLGGVLGGVSNAPPPPPPKEPIRVGGSIREPKIVKLVQPVYPPAAAKRQIAGVVVLEATVTETGTVDKVKVISGPPELVDAAIAAVRQWRYEPSHLNGVPVAVLLTARVNFSVKNAPR